MIFLFLSSVCQSFVLCCESFIIDAIIFFIRSALGIVVKAKKDPSAITVEQTKDESEERALVQKYPPRSRTNRGVAK